MPCRAVPCCTRGTTGGAGWTGQLFMHIHAFVFIHNIGAAGCRGDRDVVVTECATCARLQQGRIYIRPAKRGASDMKHDRRYALFLEGHVRIRPCCRRQGPGEGGGRMLKALVLVPTAWWPCGHWESGSEWTGAASTASEEKSETRPPIRVPLPRPGQKQLHPRVEVLASVGREEDINHGHWVAHLLQKRSFP